MTSAHLTCDPWVFWLDGNLVEVVIKVSEQIAGQLICTTLPWLLNAEGGSLLCHLSLSGGSYH